MQSATPPDFMNGMIFVCDENTSEEMFKHKVFGLPLTYFREMKLLAPQKSALFLFEKQTDLLRGIFVPTSSAKKLIVPDIWVNQEQCAFPSQIRFELHSSFSALPKTSPFAPMFLRRMKVKGKYLDKSRVNSLIVALTRYQQAIQAEQFRLLQMSVLSSFTPDYSMMHQRTPFSNMTYLQQENELLRFENEYLKLQNFMRKTPGLQDGVVQDSYASDDEIDVIDPFKLVQAKELENFFNQGENLYHNMNAPNNNQYQQSEIQQWQPDKVFCY